jgi:hypothetical protein
VTDTGVFKFNFEIVTAEVNIMSVPVVDSPNPFYNLQLSRI